MKLSKPSIEWALNHLINFSDSDLFPPPLELDKIAELGEVAISEIGNLDLPAA